jgi:uncharacterized protein (TIGR00297 family)
VYLFLFFAAAEGITLLFNKKHGKRNYLNIVGNCSACVIFILIGVLFNYLNLLQFHIFVLASIVSINAAFSDTFSSEIGKLSKKAPILITNFKKVKTGTDGGITFLGITAAIFASFISYIFFYLVGYSKTFILILFICGILGSIFDSYIGATIERKGIFNNNQTNFLASFLAGCVSILIYVLII